MSKQRAHRKSNGTPFFFRYFLSIVLRVFLSTRFSRPNTKQGYPHTKHMSFWKVLPQRISLETSLLWDLSHTFEITSDVILTTVGRKNSLQGVEALMVQCHSEVQSTEESPAKRMSFWMERSEMKNLPQRECIARDLSPVFDTTNIWPLSSNRRPRKKSMHRPYKAKRGYQRQHNDTPFFFYLTTSLLS